VWVWVDCSGVREGDEEEEEEDWEEGLERGGMRAARGLLKSV